MDSTDPLADWASGNPVAHAEEFISEYQEYLHMMDGYRFVMAVAARCFAALHDADAGGLPGEARSNVLRTLLHIQKLAFEEVILDSKKARQEFLFLHNYVQRRGCAPPQLPPAPAPAPAPAPGPTPTTPAAPAASTAAAVRKSKLNFNTFVGQVVKRLGLAAKPRPKASGPAPAPAPAASGVSATSTRRDPQPGEGATATALSPSVASAPARAAAAADNSGLPQQHPLQPLPPDVVHAILSRLDPRSAAAAAASCRSLRAATSQLLTHPLPPGFIGYLGAVQNIYLMDANRQRELSQESSEASKLALVLPLDASPVAGADLAMFQELRQKRARLLQKLEDPEEADFWMGVMRANGKGEPTGQAPNAFEEAVQRALQADARDVDVGKFERPAPHADSCPLASFRISAPVPLRPPVRRRAYGAADTAPGSAPAAACSSTADPSTSINTGGSSGSNIVPAADTGSAAATATADAVADSNTGTTDGCVIATARCDVERCNQLPVMSERYHFDGSLLAVSFPRGNTREDPGLGALVVMSSEQWEEERQRRRAERPAQRAGQHAAAAGQQQQQQQQRAAGRQQPGAGGEEEEEDEREPRQLHDIRCGGFFTGVECLCADAANGLVWAAADGGRRIKGFRAQVAPTAPGLMGCNNPTVCASATAGAGARVSTSASPSSRWRPRAVAPPRYGLQYTLCSDVDAGSRGGPVECVGLHVAGSRVVAVKANGAVLEWDLARVPPQQHEVKPHIDDCSSSEEDEEDEEQQGRPGAAAGGAAAAHQPPITSPTEEAVGFRGRLMPGRHASEIPNVEGTVGLPPDAVHLLPLPVDGAEAPLTGSRYGTPLEAGADLRTGLVYRTLMLLGAVPSGAAARGAAAAAAAPAAPPTPTHWAGVTLVVALSCNGGGGKGGGGLGGNMILAWDMETRRVRNRFFGHLLKVTDMASAPASCRQPHAFASCSYSGDVKVWDLRSSGGGAAITLTHSGTQPLSAVCLAASPTGAGADAPGGGGGGGDSGVLGAGMLCFAGGVNESIWCWDLRRGAARPLYELSTGNTLVRALAWHEPSCSLLAALEAPWVHHHGGHMKEHWLKVSVANDGTPVNDGLTGGPAGVGQAQAHAGAGEGEVAAGAGDGGAGVKRFWPRQAAHSPDQFPRYWSLAEGCVVQYRFQEGARGRVPPSQDPPFRRGFGQVLIN